MTYLVQAILNPKTTVKRLKEKGWSRPAITQFYPSFSEYSITRYTNLSRVLPAEIKLNNKQLIDLFNVIDAGGDIEALANKIGMKLEDCEDLGNMITVLMRLRTRHLNKSKFKKLIGFIGLGMPLNQIAKQIEMSYADVKTFYREVYCARPIELRD